MDPESRTQLDALLEQLEQEERALSAARRSLHDSLDLFPGNGSAEERERELSARRRELHGRIDALRDEDDSRPSAA